MRQRRWHKRRCSWNGDTFASITEAAAALGISPATLRYRLGRGYTCDADVTNARKTKPVRWNGENFRTVKEAAAKNHISKQGMMYRVKKGYTSDKDMRW